MPMCAKDEQPFVTESSSPDATDLHVLEASLEVQIFLRPRNFWPLMTSSTTGNWPVSVVKRKLAQTQLSYLATWPQTAAKLGDDAAMTAIMEQINAQVGVSPLARSSRFGPIIFRFVSHDLSITPWQFGVGIGGDTSSLKGSKTIAVSALHNIATDTDFDVCIKSGESLLWRVTMRGGTRKGDLQRFAVQEENMPAVCQPPLALDV